MGKKTQTLLVLLVLSFTASAQNTYTVNNTPGAPANYHTLQGAIDSVPAGSILLLQPSGFHYGLALIRKPLVIYGAGYLLGQNPAPNTQAIPNRSVVNYIQFGNGSQGSIISGLSFVQNPSVDVSLHERISFDSTSNITVSRCYFDFIPFDGFTHNRIFLFQNSSDMTITQCYVNLSDFVLVPIKSTNLIFTNNIFVGSGFVNFAGFYTAPFNFSFYNNSFNATFQSPDFTNGSFFNNVIIHNNPSFTATVSGGMAIADHNVSNIDIFPSGSTNITNADASNTYVGSSNPGIISLDGKMQLKAGSPAIGYAPGGIDCGAFGGPGYVLSGIPAIPNIYFANTQQSATTSGGLKVHLKIKANN